LQQYSVPVTDQLKFLEDRLARLRQQKHDIEQEKTLEQQAEVETQLEELLDRIDKTKTDYKEVRETEKPAIETSLVECKVTLRERILRLEELRGKEAEEKQAKAKESKEITKLEQEKEHLQQAALELKKELAEIEVRLKGFHNNVQRAEKEIEQIRRDFP
jgi:predicted  nucleic acid-binding Zn-ribbon protein